MDNALNRVLIKLVTLLDKVRALDMFTARFFECRLLGSDDICCQQLAIVAELRRCLLRFTVLCYLGYVFWVYCFRIEILKTVFIEILLLTRRRCKLFLKQLRRGFLKGHCLLFHAIHAKIILWQLLSGYEWRNKC